MRIEALANGAFAEIPEELLQFVRAEPRIDFALIDINADLGSIAARDDGVEIGGDFDGSADFLIDYLLAVIGSCGHDLHGRALAQGGQHPPRAFASDNHDRSNFQQSPAGRAALAPLT